jgi:hypothetical protein
MVPTKQLSSIVKLGWTVGLPFRVRLNWTIERLGWT